MLSLPSVIAPACRKRAVAVHSIVGAKYSRVFVPHEVGRPGTWQRSLYASGTPCSGPRLRPEASSASSARAEARAPSGSRVMNAWMRPSRRSIRVRHSRVASTGEILRAAIARPSVCAVQSVTRLVGGRRLALERQHEAGRLLGDREIGRRPLDRGRETGGVGAHAILRIVHDFGSLPRRSAPSVGDSAPRADHSLGGHGRRPNAGGIGLSKLTRPPRGYTKASRVAWSARRLSGSVLAPYWASPTIGCPSAASCALS